MNLKLLFSLQITCELYGKALIVQIHFTSSLSANIPTYPLSCFFNRALCLFFRARRWVLGTGFAVSML